MATTNLGTLLLGELQALSTEARRKHPEIKEAAERVIVAVRGIRATGSAEIAAELAKSDDVISPFVLGCQSNNHRLAAASVQCLQQLVSHQAVSAQSIRAALGTLSAVSSMGADIQVKVLQMVLPLVTMYDERVFGETLVEALHLCLALQRSRDPIVNNTAAAILRQVVVAVFDRVVAEDQRHHHPHRGDGADTTEDDLARRHAKDAYFVLQDLCLLAGGHESIFIRAGAVDQGLVLDLIESVLSNHAAAVGRHTAMLQTVRERLVPFVVGLFAERAAFTAAVRGIRIVWLLVRDLHAALGPECEVLLAMLARLADAGGGGGGGARRQSVSQQRPVALVPSKAPAAADDGGGSGSSSGGGAPLFYRVLGMEVARLVLRDAPLLRRLCAQYDGRAGSESHAVADLIAAVARAASERPELRASGGDGIPAVDGADQDAQVGAHNSSVRTELHRVLDKHEPPSVPETYVWYLGVTAVGAAVEALAAHVLPDGGGQPGLALDPDPGPGPDPAPDSALAATRVVVRRTWPALHAAHALCMGVRLDAALFAQTVEAAQLMARVGAALGLREARDAYVVLLCRSCLPQAAIADHERQQQLLLLQQAAEAAPAAGLGMNARQVTCLRAAAACARALAAGLGALWYPVAVTLQQAEELLRQSAGDAAEAEAAAAAVRGDCDRLLDAARAGGAGALGAAARALCVLGADLSGAPARLDAGAEAELRAAPAVVPRRLSAAPGRPTLAVELLRRLAVRNIDLLVGAAADDGGPALWAAVTRHLLATATLARAPPPVRIQAAEAVADIVLAAVDLAARAAAAAAAGPDAEPHVTERYAAQARAGEAQARALAPLLELARGEPGARFADVGRLALDTVHRLLQAAGRFVRGAWDAVFDVIACATAPRAAAAQRDGGGGGGGSAEARQPGFLMRCAFPCLQLICSDYLEDLPPHCLRRCIEALAQFGAQTEDLNISLTAIGQAWALCDFLQAGASAAAGEPGADPLASAELAGGGYGDGAVERLAAAWWGEALGAQPARTRRVLWLLLLHSLAALGRDRRHEVRLGAIQTLFRTLEMHGATFDAWMWDAVVWAVVLPLAAHALRQRARAFGGAAADLDDPHQGDRAHIASRSGLVAEDPALLLRRQWDETAATALLGAARVWGAQAPPAVWRIGRPAHAWRLAWRLAHALLAAGSAPALDAAAFAGDLDLDLDLEPAPEPDLDAVSSETAPEPGALRTRDSVAAAIGCAAALAGGAGPDGNGGAAAVWWRIGWRAWLAMGAAANAAADGHVVTQDALCTHLRQGAGIVARLRAAGRFGEADARALLALARTTLTNVAVPQSAPDAAAMTRLQALALDTMQLAHHDALALRELALLAVLPLVLRPPTAADDDDDALAQQPVVQCARAAFAPLAAAAAERSARCPSFAALAAAALDRIAAAVHRLAPPDDQEPDDQEPDQTAALARVLADGVWRDAAVAMGLHMVSPLAGDVAHRRRTSDRFAQAVAGSMARLRRCAPAGGDGGGGAALAGAWAAVGAVLDAALRPGALPTDVQIRLLDAVAEAGLRYVAPSAKAEAEAGAGAGAGSKPDDAEQPPEVAPYWAALVQILERGAAPAPGPAVLLETDEDGDDDDGTGGDEDDGDDDPHALAVACFGWLFGLSAQTMPAWVAAAAAPAMVRRSGAVVAQFGAESALLGRSPMPRARIELLRCVLGGLARLQLRPGALLLPPAAADHAARRPDAGAAAHLVAAYDALVALLPAVPDPDALRLVQQCLRRVSVEVLGAGH
ncbi:Endocytosis and vacuole integrity protein [Coemansia javaensis]|uniref:Endocytosis and vacuole integrity protein n=1 Tax=Coemansia javaensis TaxID=2761396 RepID=A0A9W8HCF2_9FUNG|nr:Endocytosis and vacuole integrity protein [Coemansia javaensis]